VLTTIDPAAYGVDPIRRIVLEGTVPAPALNQMSLTFMGNVIPVAMEVLVLIGFGVVMLGVAVRNFRIRD
jgi:ABC-2 type transport system permease protein